MARAGYRVWREGHAMDDMTIFNLRVVNKGALKAASIAGSATFGQPTQLPHAFAKSKAN
jgi:hypothetical protein